MGENDRADAHNDRVQKCLHTSINDGLCVVYTKRLGIPIQGSNFRLGITAKVETEARGPVSGWMLPCSCSSEHLSLEDQRSLLGLTNTYTSVVRQTYSNMCAEFYKDSTRNTVVSQVSKTLENDIYRKTIWDSSPNPYIPAAATSAKTTPPSNKKGSKGKSPNKSCSSAMASLNLTDTVKQTQSKLDSPGPSSSYYSKAHFPTKFQQAYKSEDLITEIDNNIVAKMEKLAELGLEIPATSTSRNPYFAEVPLSLAMFPRLNAYKRYEGKNSRLNTCGKEHSAFKANIYTVSTTAMNPIPSSWTKYPAFNGEKYQIRKTTLSPFEDGPFWSTDPGSFYLALTQYTRLGNVIYTPPGGGKTGFVYMMRNLGVRVIDSGELGVLDLPIKNGMLDATSYLIVTNSLQVTSNASKVLYVLPCESLYKKRLKEKARYEIGYKLLMERIHKAINGNPRRHFLMRCDRYLSDLPMSIDYVAPKHFDLVGLSEHLAQTVKWQASSQSPNE